MAVTWSAAGSDTFQVGIDIVVSGTTATIIAYGRASQYHQWSSGTLYRSGNWGVASSGISFSSGSSTTVKEFYRETQTFTGTRTYHAQVAVPIVGINVSVSKSVTIATASTGSINPNPITAGVTGLISVSRQSSSYLHDIDYSFGSATARIVNRVGTAANFIPDVATHARQIPNATSGWGNIIITTYNGQTYIGQSSFRYTINLPSSVKPSVDTVTLSDTTELYDLLGGYVKGISNLKVKTTSSGIYNSTIKSIETTVNGTKKTGSTTEFTLTSAGTLPINVTVADSRGRSDSHSETITVYNYETPSNLTVTTTRLNNLNQPDPFGPRAQVDYSYKLDDTDIPDLKYMRVISSRERGTTEWTTNNSTNNLTFSDTTITGSYIITDLPVDQVIDVKIDLISPVETVSFSSEISLGEVPMSWSKTGVGVGKIWQKGTLDIHGAIYHNDSLLSLPPGLVLPYTGQTAPAGYLLCDGTTFSASDYPQLAAVIGTTYGGTSANPAVPNLKKKFPFGSSGSYPVGSTGGEEEHVLTWNEMPAHTHNVYGRADRKQGTAAAIREPTEAVNGSNNTVTSSSGGSAAHNNMPPYLALHYIIKT